MPLESATASVVTYTFTHLGAPWQGALVLIGAAVAAWWGWTRYGPAPTAPWGVFARLCRALALALAVLLLAGPARVTTDTVSTPGRAVVAIDASLSMAAADGDAAGRTRLAVAGDLHRALADGRLGPEFRVIGGVAGAYQPATATATGGISALGDDLDRIVGERRPDLLVVASDWRSTAGLRPERAAAEWLRTRPGLRLAVLAVGSERIDPELALDEVIASREPTLDEQEPVRVRVAVRGSTAPIQVELLVGGQRIDGAEIPGGDEGGDPTALRTLATDLVATYRAAGAATLAVVVRSAGRERRAEIPVRVAARPLRVLMLAHRPSPEMRYLREAMRRDKTVTIHAYLADGSWRRWSQGAEAVAGPVRLPVDGSAPAGYDAIIIYDLALDSLAPAQVRALHEAVTKHATGLIWVAGELGQLTSFASSPLGTLLPIEPGERSAVIRGFTADRSFQLRRTSEAEAQGLLVPGETPWERLADLRGAWPLTRDQIRPGAEILAEDQAGAPLVVSRTFGQGRALFLAIDDTWRWRNRNAGDLYLHRFHSQLLRFVAGGRKGAGQGWRIDVQPRRVAQGELATIALLPIGRQEARAETASVRLTGPGGVRVVQLVRQGSGYSARVPAPIPGLWSVAAIGDLSAEPTDLLITPPAAETRDPRVDLATARAVAEAGGGTFHTSLADLLAALPADLTSREPVSRSEGLWDTWWAFALLIALLAIDWAIRRWQRMP